MGKKKIHFDVPCVVHDVMSYARFPQLAVELHGKGYDCTVNTVMWVPSCDYVHAAGLMPMTISVPDGKSIRTRWAVMDRNPDKEANALKAQALRHGATPEAIRLLRAMVPISKTEENTMAEKLKAKGAAKAQSTAKAPTKGNAAALKEAAAETPVGGKKGAAAKSTEKPANRKGNPEALAKARAARAVGNRNYTPLKKTKEVEFREGSWTAFMAKMILNNKSTDAAREAHKSSGEYENKSLDFKWAADKGLIAFK